MRTRLPSFAPAVLACLALFASHAARCVADPPRVVHRSTASQSTGVPQPDEHPTTSAAGSSQPLPSAGAPRDAQQIVRWAIAQLEAQPSLSAQVKQRIEAFGQTLIGSGQLLQAAAHTHRVRLEMRFRIGSRQGSLQQVCDGQRLWIYRQLADSSSLEVVDVDRVIRATAAANLSPAQATPGNRGVSALPGATIAQTLEEISLRTAGQGGAPPAEQGRAVASNARPTSAAISAQAPPQNAVALAQFVKAAQSPAGTASPASAASPTSPNAAPAPRSVAGPHDLSLGSLAIHGLAGYLRALDRAFLFRSFESTSLHGRPVWRLSGTWRPEALEPRWPDVAQALDQGKRPRWHKLPEQMPHQAVAYIDRQNGLLRRVDLLRYPAALLPQATRQPIVLASIEWLGIETGRPLDARQFRYDPGRQQPQDITHNYLQRRGLIDVPQ